MAYTTHFTCTENVSETDNKWIGCVKNIQQYYMKSRSAHCHHRVSEILVWFRRRYSYVFWKNIRRIQIHFDKTLLFFEIDRMVRNEFKSVSLHRPEIISAPNGQCAVHTHNSIEFSSFYVLCSLKLLPHWWRESTAWYLNSKREKIAYLETFQ